MLFVSPLGATEYDDTTNDEVLADVAITRYPITTTYDEWSSLVREAPLSLN